MSTVTCKACERNAFETDEGVVCGRCHSYEDECECRSKPDTKTERVVEQAVDMIETGETKGALLKMAKFADRGVHSQYQMDFLHKAIVEEYERRDL